MVSKERRILFLCLAAFILTAFLSLACGSAGWIIPGFSSSSQQWIIWLHLRLPRTIGTLMAGAALGASGAVIQSSLNNPLASPNIIGISSGAGLGVTLAAVLFPAGLAASIVLSFAGSIACALLILLLSWKLRASRMTIVLSGLALSQIFTAVSEFLLSLYPDALSSYASFKTGSAAFISLSRLPWVAAVILICLVLLVCFARQMDMLRLGSQQARALGLNSEKWTLVLLLLAAVLAACAVSLCGLVGFVGLIVPSVFRKKISSTKLWLLISALGGGFLLCLADLFGRLVAAPYEIPAGILTALIGGPFFLYLLFSKGRHGHG